MNAYADEVSWRESDVVDGQRTAVLRTVHKGDQQTTGANN